MSFAMGDDSSARIEVKLFMDEPHADTTTSH